MEEEIFSPLHEILQNYETIQIKSKVYCYWPDDSRYYPGFVSKIDNSKAPKDYFVEFDDGDSCWIEKYYLVPKLPIDQEIVCKECKHEIPVVVKNGKFLLKAKLLPNDGLYFINGDMRVKPEKNGVFLNAGEYLKFLEQSKARSPKHPKPAKVENGEKVFAYWGETKSYYRGKVSSMSGSHFQVKFDDGDSREYSSKNVDDIVQDRIPKESDLKVGTNVISKWKDSNQFYDGMIWAKLQNENGECYHVVYYDQSEAAIKREHLRVKTRQTTTTSTLLTKKSDLLMMMDGGITYEEHCQIMRTFKYESLTGVREYPLDCKLYSNDPVPEITAVLKKLGKKFIDYNFRNICSAYDHGMLRVFKCCCTDRFIQWKRVCEMDNVKFCSTNYPMLFKQSKTLGDCWLIAFFHFLQPDLIKSIFSRDNLEVNPFGLYSVKLNVFGEDKYVLIDDFIPLYKGEKSVFIESNDNLCDVLLEKAFAKFFGSYMDLCGGKKGLKNRFQEGDDDDEECCRRRKPIPLRSKFISRCLFNCTEFSKLNWQAPECEENENGGNAAPKEKIWNCLETAFGKGDIVNICKVEANPFDLETGHVFSVMGIYALGDERETKLIEMRNPQGQPGTTYWSGEWNKSDDIWEKVDEKWRFLKMRISEGTFMISLDDFGKYVREINVYSSSKMNEIID